MDGDGAADVSGLGDSFLAAGTQYVVEGGGDGDDSQPEEEREEQPLREQDRFLPIANVARIMKKSIPNTGKIAKDAKECVQECVSEFISFITSEASERCHQEKRKTINGEDILFAMSTLGFDNYVEPLKVYLQKYRESTKGDKVIGGLETSMDDLADDTFTTTQITNILSQDQGQANVIYTTSYPTQGTVEWS